MDVSAYINIPIFAIVYLLMEAAKRLVLKNNKLRGLIPIIAPIAGAVISCIIYSSIPEWSTSTNGLEAFTTGVFSGAATTGGHQIYKQLYKFLNSEYEEE